MGCPSLMEEVSTIRETLLRALGTGHEHALTAQYLASLCGQRDHRMVRKTIRDLISEDYPIAACSKGYFFAETRQEVELYSKDLRKRLIKDAIRRRDFRRASRGILHPEQLKLGV